MSESDSSEVEVDADELSEEVTSELVGTETYEEDEAEEWGERVWLEEQMSVDPERTGLLARGKGFMVSVLFMFVSVVVSVWGVLLVRFGIVRLVRLLGV